MRLDTVLGFFLWWLLGTLASYALLSFYESVRPYDATIEQDEKDKKAMGKLAIQAGLIVSIIWFMVRLNSRTFR